MPALAMLLTASFALCTNAPRHTCVVDGDTFWLAGEKIRIADINAPETHGAGCVQERSRGEAAAQRLTDLLNRGRFELVPTDRDRDRYGRKLKVVVREGRSIGAQLVAEGLAETWRGRRGDWCRLSNIDTKSRVFPPNWMVHGVASASGRPVNIPNARLGMLRGRLAKWPRD